MQVVIQEQRVEEAVDGDQDNSYETEPTVAPREQRSRKGAFVVASQAHDQNSGLQRG